ncbi:MAG: ATP-binding cassette domain-containing protein [Candidatus Dojkabacteria bacterium]
MNFKIDKGQKLAIVGESGEGKSTITNLILRFYEPKSGEILIDKTNISDITQKSLHENISVVLQDSILFSGSVTENIRYGKDDATVEDVIEAAKKANAHDFVSKFEKGYDTEIGERGIKLSGGQKQRISIARAILKNSPILILDEATSSLDSKAEAEVQKALTQLMEGKTTIIIAHRLSTIRNVDQIIVLKSGSIAEHGTPAELIQKDGIYAELVKLQTNLNNVEPSAKMKEFKLVG